MSLEDLPLDIRAKILGRNNLPDLVDLARVRAVSRAMREAAEKVRARVGRTPFTVEVLKELAKK